MPRDHTRTTAYSYIRFSSKRQGQGDSLRRQTDGRAGEYCKRRGWKLSAQTYEDLGVSAYHGKNALVGNLGEFLRAIREDAVKPGSVLIVESLDRISRQGIDEGYDLIKHILKSGVRIVTLSPEREFDQDATRSLSKGALEIQLILERAAEESERKGERVAAARRQERERLRKTGEVVNGHLPSWVRKGRDGKPVLVPERAAAVRTVLRLAGAGYGVASIVARLNRDRVPPITRCDHWSRSYVTALLGDRRVLGEFQPRCGGKPDGDPVKDFFPAVVSEAEWLAARAGAAARKRHPRWAGRLGKGRINLFAGLLVHARDGDSYQMTTTRSYPAPKGTPKGKRGRGKGKRGRGPTGEPRHYHVLVNSHGTDGTARAYSLPLDPFEEAVFDWLREIDPGEVLGDAAEPGDEVADLETLHDGVEAERAEAEAYMNAHGFSATIGRRITELEARKRELEGLMADARHEAANPMRASWDEAKSLMDAVRGAADPADARLRLRAALRRIVEEVRLLVVPRGRGRLCAIQVFFRGAPRPYDLSETFLNEDGEYESPAPTHRRDYLFYYRPASGSFGRVTPAVSKVRSWRAEDVLGLNKEDLRDPTQVGWVEHYLKDVPLELLWPE
jgi:DNA invertase Pin-like site-specific DNA recombinase